MPQNTYIRLLVVLMTCLPGGHALYAQATARKALQSAKSLNCEFKAYATGIWTNDEAIAQVQPRFLSIRFDAIDTQDGTAQVNGMLRASDAVARLAEGTLHFMTVDNSGPLYVTTVFDSEARRGKLKAVHTRHEYADVSPSGFSSRPEQYYGECEVGP
jgi:hypothetical protein